MGLDFDEIYNEVAPSVFRYLRRLTGSRAQAEDVLQETFLRFYTQLKNKAEFQNYRTWLFSVATNVFKDQRRSEVRAAIREENYGKTAKIIDFQKDFENQEIVHLALADLAPRMRRVLLLSAEGFSYREISVIADIEVMYVGVLLQRARAAFKKHCEQDGHTKRNRYKSPKMRG